MESIGVRELRQHASRWLARVESGESFEITDRGRPVAALVPARGSDWDRLVRTGSVLPGGSGANAIVDIEPVEDAGRSSLSTLLAADRADER